jgi:hypothetical protein
MRLIDTKNYVNILILQSILGLSQKMRVYAPLSKSYSKGNEEAGYHVYFTSKVKEEAKLC